MDNKLMFHYIMNYADNNGEFIHETYTTKENSQQVQKKRIIGYKPKNPKKYTIIITDHIRKVKPESNFTLKQTIDKWISYQVWLRNICGFTFVNIVHTNRDLGDVDKLKFMKDEIYPTSDSVKDSGNLSEESDYVITLFNPSDDKYQITKHFNIPDVHKYPNLRSFHLVESRDTECPIHTHLNFVGNLGLFQTLKNK